MDACRKSQSKISQAIATMSSFTFRKRRTASLSAANRPTSRDSGIRGWLRSCVQRLPVGIDKRIAGTALFYLERLITPRPQASADSLQAKEEHTFDNLLHLRGGKPAMNEAAFSMSGMASPDGGRRFLTWKMSSAAFRAAFPTWEIASGSLRLAFRTSEIAAGTFRPAFRT